jgi:hypothetical protein
MVHMEEILPQIEIRVNPQVSFTQGYQDGNMQDSEGSQVVKLEAVVLQERVEEWVQRHAEPSLVESHKGHHVSLRRSRERRILRHPTGFELCHQHKPVFHEILHVPQHNGRRSLVLLYHGSGRKKGQHLHDPDIPTSNFFSLSLSLCLAFSLPFLSKYREGSKERVMDGVRGYRGMQGRPPGLNPAALMVKRLGHSRPEQPERGVK